MSKKIKKLREVNESLNKRLDELETYMFVENILNLSTVKVKNDMHKHTLEIN